MRSPPSAFTKFVRASFAIVLGSAIFYGIGLFAEAGRNIAEPLIGESGVSLKQVFSDSDLAGISRDLPEGFEVEVFPLVDFYDVLLAEEKSVVGLFSHDSVEEVYAFCSEELVQRGWKKVESGYLQSATFIKAEGRFTWLFISCSEIGGDTSVVVQYV